MNSITLAIPLTLFCPLHFFLIHLNATDSFGCPTRLCFILHKIIHVYNCLTQWHQRIIVLRIYIPSCQPTLHHVVHKSLPVISYSDSTYCRYCSSQQDYIKRHLRSLSTPIHQCWLTLHGEEVAEEVLFCTWSSTYISSCLPQRERTWSYCCLFSLFQMFT